MNTLYDLSADVYEQLNPSRKEGDSDSDTDADDDNEGRISASNKKQRKNQTRGLAQEKAKFKEYVKQKEEKQKTVSYYIAGYACHQGLKIVFTKEKLSESTLAVLRGVCTAPKCEALDDTHVTNAPSGLASLIDDRERHAGSLIRCADWLFSFMWDLRVHVFDTYFGKANIRHALLGDEYIPYVKDIIFNGDIYRRMTKTVKDKIYQVLWEEYDARKCAKLAKTFVRALTKSYTNVAIKEYMLFLKKMLDKAKEKSADLRTSFRKEKDIRHKIKVEKSGKRKMDDDISANTKSNSKKRKSNDSGSTSFDPLPNKSVKAKKKKREKK
jgi:hypothetical protein